MRQIIVITGGIIGIMTLLVLTFTGRQVNKEGLSLTFRLQSRTQVIADSLAESIEPYYTKHATSSVEKIVDRITGNERVAGLGVFDNKGLPVVISNDFPKEALSNALVTTVMDSDEPEG